MTWRPPRRGDLLLGASEGKPFILTTELFKEDSNDNYVKDVDLVGRDAQRR